VVKISRWIIVFVGVMFSMWCVPSCGTVEQVLVVDGAVVVRVYSGGGAEDGSDEDCG
jgi:hypothetical protein